MLNGISKLLTGDMLKVLCDMGHGDELVLADANFPGEAIAACTGRPLIRLPGLTVSQVAEAIRELFPLDSYSIPCILMDLTDGDKAKGMPEPEAWKEYQRLLPHPFEKIERFAFYERAIKAYAVIQTGEERQYGNLILVKGVVL